MSKNIKKKIPLLPIVHNCYPTGVDLDMIIDKKKAETPSPKTKDVAMAKGMFDFYPAEPKEDWSEFVRGDDGGVCRVHKDEMEVFQINYRQCHLSGKWHVGHDMQGILEDDLGRVYPFNAVAAGWWQCSKSGYWGEKKQFFTARTKDNKPCKVGLIFLDEYFTCDLYKELFPNGMRCIIKGSKKYKVVSHHALTLSLKFLQCPECAKWFESKDVTLHKPLGFNSCESCWKKYQYKGAILPHNDHSHPAPIFTPQSRYGCVLKKGLIFATNMQVDVPGFRLFGVEAETEIHLRGAMKAEVTRLDLAVEAKKHLTPDFITVKEDGTLLMNGHYNNNAKDPKKNKDTGPMYAGFEIATAPADLDAHRKYWPKIEEMEHYKLLRAWDTDTCGFHVHVNRSSLPTLQIGRMLRFVNHPANQRFIFKIAGRNSDKFCRYLDKEVSDILHPERVVSPEEDDHYNRSRRVALNISNKETVEFRIFRGTVNPKHIIRNIEFCDAVCEFCYPASRSLLSLSNYPEFIHFVGMARKKWPILAAWFVYQKDLTLRQHNKGADVSKFTIQPDMVVEDVHEHFELLNGKGPEIEPDQEIAL